MAPSQEDLHALFARYDRDGDGRIDRHELREALREQRGADPSPEALEATLSALDEDGDGAVDLEEFIAAMRAFRRARG